MTRFARAKGSKASNLKTPEDSTPWEVMKEHMMKAKQENEEAKKREEAEQQRIDNYNNFLKEHKVQKRKATWCDFPEAQLKKATTNETNKEQKEKKKKKKIVQNITLDANSDNFDVNTNQELKNENHQKKKKKNKANMQQSENSHNGTAKTNGNITNDNEDLQVINENNQKKKKKKKAKVEQCGNVSSKDDDLNSKHNLSPMTKKKKFTLSQQEITPSENLTNQDTSNISGQDKVQSVQNKNKKNKVHKKKTPSDKSTTEEHSDKTSNNTSTETNSNKIHNEPIKKKKNKLKKGEQPIRRKPMNDRSFQFIINGKEVELVRYDGFPIMRKDAERLDELKQNMIKKGIPKSEVQRTMKLERRRAEKALARVKREVCYNCRKGGHNLSDCPDLKSNLPGVDAAEGLCFKCGSTEHRQFECKVQRDKEFRFATCFICKESGHIARQCPDNPKGLYPNGGCCKLCGDVTHLRKDCPTVKDKKEDSTIKLQTLHDDNIEDIGQNVKSVSQETVKKPKKIKF